MPLPFVVVIIKIDISIVVTFFSKTNYKSMAKKVCFIVLISIANYINAQVFFKGTINDRIDENLNVRARAILITDPNKFNFKSFENIDLQKRIYKDTVNNNYHFIFPITKPTILLFQIDSWQNYIYVQPNDTINFNLHYVDGLSASENSLSKWIYFPEKDTLLKACTITYWGSEVKENSFLFRLQKEYGIILFPRIKYPKGMNLLDYQGQEVNNIYINQLNALNEFCQTNKKSQFYILAHELIEGNFVMNLLEPKYSSKDTIPSGYFSNTIVHHINTIIQQPSKSYYLQFAKYLLNDCFLTKSDKYYGIINNEKYFIDRYYSCKSHFKNSNDYNFISSNIIKYLIFNNTFNDTVLQDYLKYCTNKLWTNNLLNLYNEKKNGTLSAKINFAHIIKQDTIYNSNGNPIANIVDSFPKDKFLLLDFWATWCKPCLNNMPYLVDISHRATIFKKISILTLSFDFEMKQWLDMIDSKIDKNKLLALTSQQFLLKNNFKSKIAQAFNINSIPRYILISPDLRVIDINLPQPINEEAFLRAIKRAIDKNLDEKYNEQPSE